MTTYCLFFLDRTGNLEPILLDQSSARKVRNVAQKIKEKPGRSLLITRDGKRLQGGAAALDRELYQRWLEEHNED